MTHPTTGELLGYWLHESDDAATDAIDEHLMQCEACGERLDELIALGRGVRAALRAGAVAAVASDAFVRRLAGQGLRVREHRLPHNGSVNCTLAPDDELLAAHLEAPLDGVQRLDMVTRLLAPERGGQQVLQDIPFDARSGEVLFISKLAEVRQMPAHSFEVRLLAVQPDGQREVGRYVFHHRLWRGG